MRKQYLAPYTVLVSMASAFLFFGVFSTIDARRGGGRHGGGRMHRGGGRVHHHRGGRRGHHGGRGYGSWGRRTYVYPAGYYGSPWLDYDDDYYDDYYNDGPGFGIYFGV